jgi:HPt (histidine-containing phosphotransfer) domain-containing protein
MSPHWDRATALHRLEGDESLLQELIAISLEEYPTLCDRLRQGLASDDFSAVRETAHGLKGSLAYVGFVEAANLALALEKACHMEDAARAGELASALMIEIEAVQQMMASTGAWDHAAVIE